MRLVVPARATSTARALQRAAATSPTYAPDAEGTDHDRFAHDRYAAVVGRGVGDFDAARTGLRQWRAHELRGVRVLPRVPPEPGATHLVTFGTPLMAIGAPCRVSSVLDEERRWGFAYVTLPGHPEQGEESFTVDLDHRGVVRFVVAATSRPAGPLERLGAPIARRVQSGVTRAYLRALARHVASSRG